MVKIKKLLPYIAVFTFVFIAACVSQQPITQQSTPAEYAQALALKVEDDSRLSLAVISNSSGGLEGGDYLSNYPATYTILFTNNSGMVVNTIFIYDSQEKAEQEFQVIKADRNEFLKTTYDSIVETTIGDESLAYVKNPVNGTSSFSNRTIIAESFITFRKNNVRILIAISNYGSDTRIEDTLKYAKIIEARIK